MHIHTIYCWTFWFLFWTGFFAILFSTWEKSSDRLQKKQSFRWPHDSSVLMSCQLPVQKFHSTILQYSEHCVSFCRCWICSLFILLGCFFCVVQIINHIRRITETIVWFTQWNEKQCFPYNATHHYCCAQICSMHAQERRTQIVPSMLMEIRFGWRL